MFLEMMTNMRRNVIYSMFMFKPALQLLNKAALHEVQLRARSTQLR